MIVMVCLCELLSTMREGGGTFFVVVAQQLIAAVLQTFSVTVVGHLFVLCKLLNVY
eukprot:m.23135 g.23135  ORF g.23135 m.23135 type:complete len:56 (-) comp5522_c1_seq1:316-483(-)